MKELFRGGIVVLLLSTLAVFIYARRTTNELMIAAASTTEAAAQTDIDNSLIDAFNDQSPDENVVTPGGDDEDKKLVKTTASVKAAGMGAGKGAFSATAYCFSGRT